MRPNFAPARSAARRAWSHVGKDPGAVAAIYGCMMLCFLALVARPDAGLLAYPPLAAGAFGAAAFAEQVVSQRKATST